MPFFPYEICYRTHAVKCAKLFRFVISIHSIACCCCLVSLGFVCASIVHRPNKRNKSNEINGQKRFKTNIYPRTERKKKQQTIEEKNVLIFRTCGHKSVVHCVAWKNQWETLPIAAHKRPANVVLQFYACFFRFDFSR